MLHVEYWGVHPNMLIGLWYSYFVVGYGLFWVWTNALVVYGLCRVVSRSHAPMIVFVLSMSALSER